MERGGCHFSQFQDGKGEMNIPSVVNIVKLVKLNISRLPAFELYPCDPELFILFILKDALIWSVIGLLIMKPRNW
jgi:hypothetical protein